MRPEDSLHLYFVRFQSELGVFVQTYTLVALLLNTLAYYTNFKF